LRKKVTVLHCTTEYPAPLDDINLKAINTIRSAFNLNVGYSDHSEGILVPIAAVPFGVSIIEKHFTLDKSMEGPDHKASLSPSELKEMVQSIRAIEQTMGDGLKGPRPSEVGNVGVARKSLVAAADIHEGELFTDTNLEIKRPGSGVAPINYWSLVGKQAQKKYTKGQLIEE